MTREPGTTRMHRHVVDRIEVTRSPARADLQYIEDQLDAYNLARSGIPDARLFAVVARDANDAIIGGLYGWIWGRSSEIKTLWVHQGWRGKGLGTRLLAAAEAEVRAAGAVQIVVSTHSFQAPEFYRRLGFEAVARIPDHPIGFDSIWLVKRLG